MKPTNLVMSLKRRPAVKNGPMSSDSWNDSMRELAVDISTLLSQWNTRLVKLAATIPDGSDDKLVDAWKNGLDGRTLYVDAGSTSTSEGSKYWNATRTPPATVKELIS